MKPFAIVTASDRKYGDFLIEHWLRSLRENVCLDSIDVIVLDYGLSQAQRFYLARHGVFLRAGTRDGHVTVLRYRETRDLLRERAYQQVCLCDSGDLIFQDDIAPLFERHPESFRAVCEDYKPVFSFFIRDDCFRPVHRQQIAASYNEHRMINAGFLIAPRSGMVALCAACLEMIQDPGRFGLDQLVVNHVLHQQGFEELERRYNFVVVTSAERFRIEEGLFVDEAGRRIAVVHNAGNYRFLRPIDRFGYGPGYNVLKQEIYATLRRFYASREGLATAQETVHRSRRELAGLIRRIRSTPR
jgi:hypothetical protein